MNRATRSTTNAAAGHDNNDVHDQIDEATTGISHENSTRSIRQAAAAQKRMEDSRNDEEDDEEDDDDDEDLNDADFVARGKKGRNGKNKKRQPAAATVAKKRREDSNDEVIQKQAGNDVQTGTATKRRGKGKATEVAAGEDEKAESMLSLTIGMGVVKGKSTGNMVGSKTAGITNYLPGTFTMRFPVLVEEIKTIVTTELAKFPFNYTTSFVDKDCLYLPTIAQEKVGNANGVVMKEMDEHMVLVASDFSRTACALTVVVGFSSDYITKIHLIEIIMILAFKLSLGIKTESDHSHKSINQTINKYTTFHLHHVIIYLFLYPLLVVREISIKKSHDG